MYPMQNCIGWIPIIIAWNSGRILVTGRLSKYNLAVFRNDGSVNNAINNTINRIVTFDDIILQFLVGNFFVAHENSNIKFQSMLPSFLK